MEAASSTRLIDAVASEGAELEPLAKMFVSDAGGALRTLLGDAHRHAIGTYPSLKTGLAQPYEGLGEQALVQESELDPDVLDYQTQAFRLRLLLGAVAVEWICDHLRQLADGTVEAIEVKQRPGQMDDLYHAKMVRVHQILTSIGWRFRIRYEREIVGEPQLALNRGHILAHRSSHVRDDQWAAFERLRGTSPSTTYGIVRDAMDPRRLQGAAAVHALLCKGRVSLALDAFIRDGSPVELRPEPRFNSAIRF